MSDSVQPIVLFLSGDLMFFSKISGAAQLRGCKGVMAGSVAAIADRCQPDDVRFVCLDLAKKYASLPEVVEQLRAMCPAAQLIAFGPHVEREALQAALAAGVDLVMTRGEFTRELPSLFVPH